MLTLAQFDYILPPELIAQTPATPRDHSRLLVLRRSTGRLEHHHFFELPELLPPNTVLVRNNSKVIPARLFGQKLSGGKCEALLLNEVKHSQQTVTWECLTKPGLRLDQEIRFLNGQQEMCRGRCVGSDSFTRTIEFSLNKESFLQLISQIGQLPLPPYISSANFQEAQKESAYQTTYAKVPGSVAAPTAGLHFTPELDQKLLAQGHKIIEITLHVGIGTFLPVREEQLQHKTLHQEYYSISSESATSILAARAAGQPIITVGTTSTRALESFALTHERVGNTQLFIQPGFQFQFSTGLITNFHLPKTSLLMLVSAFVSAPNTQQPFTTFSESLVGRGYLSAIQEKYRFFSFGDAMLIL